MSIIVRRALLTAACGVGLAVSPAQAQTDRDMLLDTLLDCSEIRDQAARGACYDDNIRHFRFSLSGAQKPEQTSDGQRDSGASVDATAVSAEAGYRPPVRRPPRPFSSSEPPNSITLAIATVIERAPGSYIVTLEDGAVWEFLDDMPLSYRPPMRGSFVKIDPGALGSYRMRFDRQQPVRVRRAR